MPMLQLPTAQRLAPQLQLPTLFHPSAMRDHGKNYMRTMHRAKQ